MLDASYTQVPFDNFADFPEPEPPAPTVPRHRGDAFQDGEKSYLAKLDDFINKLGAHVRRIQNQDLGGKMKEFVVSLQAKDEKPAEKEQKDGEDDEDDQMQNHKSSLKSVQKRRKQYREMIKDAMEQRQLYLDSELLRQHEEQSTRQKINRLHITEHKMTESREKTTFDLFSTILILAYLVIILVYTVATNWGVSPSSPPNDGYYAPAPNRADDLYSYYVHILLLITFGFGYLNVWLKKYGFSAVGYNFLLVAFTMVVAILSQLMWRNIYLNPSNSWDAASLTIASLVDAAYVAAAVSVTWSVIAGKCTIVELMIVAFLEVIFYGLNYYINIYLLGAVDPGGAMTIHVFGCYFGIGAAYWLSKPWSSTELRPYLDAESASTYHSEFVSLVATLFCWCFFPSFNAATAPDGTQYRAVVNTFVGLVGSTIFAFFASRTLRRKHFQMREIQNATLAGAIAMASGHSVVVAPGAAIVIGSVAGAFSVMGFMLFQPWVEKKFPFKIYDTRGANNLHGLAGIIGGIASAIALGIGSEKVYGQSSHVLFPHGMPNQGGYQAGCLFISFGIGIGGGFLVGLGIWIIRRIAKTRPNKIFCDQFEWVVPAGYAREKSNGGLPEP